MTKEQLKQAADVIRAVADEIESGRWGSVDWDVENDLRAQRVLGRLVGHELLGRTITIRLALPAPEVK